MILTLTDIVKFCHNFGPDMIFLAQILGRFNRARAARLTLPHYVCQTPLFMPVGTQGQNALI